jgi:hypothetical protein
VTLGSQKWNVEMENAMMGLKIPSIMQHVPKFHIIGLFHQNVISTNPSLPNDIMG